jgi:isopenicillin N synthase-like dioxygenase
MSILFDHKAQQLPIPVIDLSNSDSSSLLRHACETTGFFYLKNEHVLARDEALHATEMFFNQSNDIKIKCLCNSSNLGYTSFQDETLAPDIQSCGDTKEGYYIIDEKECIISGKTNVWPDERLLCDWKDIMLRYHLECKSMGDRIVRLLLESLEVPSEIFDKYFTSPTAILRLLKYGNVISEPSSGVFGCGPHSDYGMITLLTSNDVPGLEILYNDEWIAIPPPPNNYFIVNLGDCLQRFTNGKLKSTVHRVLINNSDKPRFSMAYFYEPNRDSVVECLPQFVSISNPPSYEPILYGEYLSNKYNKTSLDYKNANSTVI